MTLINKIRMFYERHGLDVSSRIAEFFGIKVKSIRLFFIYLSLITLIGGFILYVTLAFCIKLKDFIYTKRPSVFDL